MVGTSGTTQVTVVGQYSGTGISQPGGTVSYVMNGITDTATITAGVATIPLPSTWSIGSYTIAVTYSGDGNYTGAPSITVPFSVTATAAADTTTSLKSSATTAPFGTSVTLTAAVAASTGSTVPSGNVTFTSGTTLIGTSALNGTGIATYSATNLPVGTDSITATYGGSTAFSTSLSSVVEVTVTTLSTSTIVTASSATATAGTAITFTATVAPKTPSPTGTVSFNDGTKALGSGTINSLGVATYSTSALATGTHSIIAIYGGDADHSTSTSSALTETITSVVPPSAGFTITAKSTSLSIQQGSSGTVQLTLTALNGFSEAVTLSCSGLPADSTCTVPSPSTPTAAGTSTSVTINTDTTSAIAQLQSASATPGSHNGEMTALAGAGLAGFTLLFGIPARRRLGRLSSLYSVMMALVLAGALASLSVGCGGGSSSSTPTTPVGTSTVLVSATAGTGASAITQTVSVQVNVTN